MKTSPGRILCATDFSVNAGRAADVAAAISVRLGGTMTLVDVTDEAQLTESLLGSVARAVVVQNVQPVLLVPAEPR